MPIQTQETPSPTKCSMEYDINTQAEQKTKRDQLFLFSFMSSMSRSALYR